MVNVMKVLIFEDFKYVICWKILNIFTENVVEVQNLRGMTKFNPFFSKILYFVMRILVLLWWTVRY